jgi:hypothetical protein
MRAVPFDLDCFVSLLPMSAMPLQLFLSLSSQLSLSGGRKGAYLRSSVRRAQRAVMEGPRAVVPPAPRRFPLREAAGRGGVRAVLYTRPNPRSTRMCGQGTATRACVGGAAVVSAAVLRNCVRVDARTGQRGGVKRGKDGTERAARGMQRLQQLMRPRQPPESSLWTDRGADSPS